MKKRLMSFLIAGVAGLPVLAAVPAAQAGTNSDSISIHFGAEQPTEVNGSMLAPTDVAGVIESANWNNTTGNTGTATGLIEDKNGVATTSSAQVFWQATNTWASTGKSEEGNNFTDANKTLMSGYLDMSTAYPSFTYIQVSNLPASFSGTYDLYIYAMGSYPGKGGECTVIGATPSIQWIVGGGLGDPSKPGPGGSPPQQGQFSGPDFVQALGTDSTFGANGDMSDFGNYLMFPGLSGSTATIIAINLPMPGEAKGSILPGYNPNPRAPINGIQLVVD
jgi:hypothetical protein